MMNTPSLLQRQWPTTTPILGAVVMGLLATDFRAIADEKRVPGIAGITKGRPALTVPAEVPAGETRWYGVGFALQVAPGLAGLLCNRHIERCWCKSILGKSLTKVVDGSAGKAISS